MIKNKKMKKLFPFLFAITIFISGSSQQQLNRTLYFDGENRTFIIYIPAIYDGSIQVPLMFNFHGGAGTSSSFMSYSNDMRPIADTANFIAVYPQAAVDPSDGSNSWLHKTPTTHNDIFFIEAIIDTLSSEFMIDNDRVYACGYSEGGIFSYELGCRLNNRIAAFSSVSGSMLEDAFRVSYYNLGVCSPIHPTAVLLIPGTSDFSPHSTYSGLQPYYMSANDITTYWANYNNTDPSPNITQVPNSNSSDGSNVERRTWENGDNCVSIEELKVINGGHDWPGSSGNMDISASEEIWNFVSKYNTNGLIDCGVSSFEEDNNEEISIYPNPANHTLIVNKLNNNISNFYIYTLVGKLVSKGKLTSHTIDVSHLPADLYFIKIENKSYKFLKN